MRILKFVAPAAVLALSFGLLLSPNKSFGKAEYAKKEKKGCTFCHVKAGSKDLNDAGKYYKAHDHSMEGYVAKP